MTKITEHSETFNEDVSFEVYDGKITHNSLLNIGMRYGIMPEYEAVVAGRDYNLFKCTMKYEDKVSVEFGEAFVDNLETDIARKYPGLTATKRAYDRALISMLGFSKRYYSTEEIAVDFESTVPEARPTVASATVVKEEVTTGHTAPVQETPLTVSQVPGPDSRKTELERTVINFSKRYFNKTIGDVMAAEEDPVRWLKWAASTTETKTEDEKRVQAAITEYLQLLA